MRWRHCSSYPDEALIAALPEIKASFPRRSSLSRKNSGCKDLYSLQEQYVSLFDRSRALSLHLFEHVHGETARARASHGRAGADVPTARHERRRA